METTPNAANGSNSANNSTPPNPDGTGQTINATPVSAEQFKELSENLKTLMNWRNAEIRRAKEATTQTPEPKQDEPGTVKEEIAKMRAEMKAEKMAALKEMKDSKISGVISSYGLDADRTELLEALVAKHSDNIQVNNAKQVVYRDVVGDEMPVKDFIENIVRQKGDLLKPALENLPSGRGLMPTPNSPQGKVVRYEDMPQEERMKLTPQQVAAKFKQGGYSQL